MGETKNGIRNLVQYYTFTKGGNRGCIAWGIALDFVMVPKGKKLTSNRTEQSAMIHMGEWAEGYANSFRGKEMKDGNGVASHYRDIAKKTIIQAMEGELDNIRSFFARASTLEGIIGIAEEQIHHPKSPIYTMKFPSPLYILAFIYAYRGEMDKALDSLEKDAYFSDEQNLVLKNRVKDHLFQLSKNPAL